MSEPRKARLSVTYEGESLSDQIGKYLEEFSFTDIASGESDRIDLKLNDTERKWAGSWMPKSGDRIKSTIEFQNWFMDGARDNLFCGEFEIDKLSFSGRPFQCSIGAVSIPQDSAFCSQSRTKTWENATVKLIASEIAQRAGVNLHYEGDTIEIESIEQNDQTDCAFLYEICESYGLAMKVFSNKIVIFDEEKYERQQAATRLYEQDTISWNYNIGIAGTYTGATFSFADPNNEEEYTIDIGGGNRIYEINVTADNMKDAERKGIAMLNNENKKHTKVSITMKANPGIYAGSCIVLDGFMELDGKFYVETVKTGLSGKGATQMKLELRKVVDRIKTSSIRSAEEAAKEAAGSGTEYTVKQGDSLWMLAKKFLDDPMRYSEIYNRNKEIIEQTAKSRGKDSSYNGHWIFAGTLITIPAK